MTFTALSAKQLRAKRGTPAEIMAGQFALVDTELDTLATAVNGSNLSATHKITRSATIVIAASDSSAKSKAQADYVCDGTDDEADILDAISELESTGGKIDFAEGTYNTEQIVTSESNFELVGKSGTVFRLPDARYSQLTESIDANDTNVIVDDGTQFIVGDYIIVRGTNAVEARKITNVSGDTLTLDSALTYSNPSTDGQIITRHHIMRLSGNNINIKNITFDGNYDNQAAGLNSTLFPSGVTNQSQYLDSLIENSLIHFDASSFLNIENCRFLNSDQHGIHGSTYGGTSTSDIIINNNCFNNMRDKAIVTDAIVGTDTITRYRIENNTIMDVGISNGMAITGLTWGDAIQFHNATSHSWIINNYIYNWRRNAIRIAPNSNNINIKNNILNNTASYATDDEYSFYISGSNLDLSGNSITIPSNIKQNILYSSDCNSLKWINNRSIGGGNSSNNNSYAYCFYATNSNMIFSKNTIENAVSTAAMIALSGTGVTKNIFSNNVLRYPAATCYAGILLLSGSDYIISDNQIYDGNSKLSYMIRKSSGSPTNVIIKNNIFGAGTVGVFDTTSAFTIKNNIGYMTENTGTATITASQTSVDVTHGLAAAPTRVQLTPTTATAGKDPRVTAKAATTFTITIESAHSADISFDWRAEV